MGIHDLAKVIKSQLGDNYTTRIPLTMFYGKRIGIDTAVWANANYSVCWNIIIAESDLLAGPPDERKVLSLFLQKCLDLVCKFIEFGVTPVFIFDGIPPPQKLRVKQKRKEQRQKQQNKLEYIEQQFDTYRNTGNGEELPAISALVMSKMSEQYLGKGFLTTEATLELQNMLTVIGIPHIRARTDAEKLGSFLCREGHLDAFYTTDTDVLVYGCPLWLREFDGTKVMEVPSNTKSVSVKRPVPMMTAIYLETVLEGLRLPHSEFIDFCILAGCDFNQKVKGIGIEKLYQRFIKHESADLILSRPGSNADEVDLTTCREIFKYTPSYQWTFNYRDPTYFTSPNTSSNSSQSSSSALTNSSQLSSSTPANSSQSSSSTSDNPSQLSSNTPNNSSQLASTDLLQSASTIQGSTEISGMNRVENQESSFNFILDPAKLTTLARSFLSPYALDQYVSKLYYIYRDCPVPTNELEGLEVPQTIVSSWMIDQSISNSVSTPQDTSDHSSLVQQDNVFADKATTSTLEINSAYMTSILSTLPTINNGFIEDRLGSKGNKVEFSMEDLE